MFGIGVQEKKKSQVMIADRRFHPKDIQDIIKTAVNTGNMLVNQDEYAKYLFEYNGFKIIGENFKTKKNSNKENEAFINFRNLELMNKRTIESYKPIMAFVNNKSNSSDGWLFYHNRYSEPCKQIHYVQIIDLLNDLHLKKMVFLNPGIKNFLYDGTRVFVSDVKIKKNNLGKIGEFLNFISLKNTAFIFEKIYTFKDNLLYKLLVQIDKFFHFSKNIPELSVNYFKESKEELEKITTKMKKNENKNEVLDLEDELNNFSDNKNLNRENYKNLEI